jgi:hypothetical protein
MWIAIVFLCIANAGCDFVVSPAVETKAECQAMIATVKRNLDADPAVVAYAEKCEQVVRL